MVTMSRSTARQILASSVVLLSSFVHGCKDGYLQAAVPMFLSNSPFTVSAENISWIASISFSGTIVAVIIRHLIGDQLSRKTFLIGCTLIAAVAWFLILCTSSVTVTIVSLFFYGAASNVISIIGHVYFGEIALPTNRELLGIVINLLYALGTQVEFPLSVFESYRVLAFFPFLMSIVNVLLGLLMVESPYYLIVQNADDEALENLRWLNDNSATKDMSIEMGNIKKYVDEQRMRIGDLKVIFLPDNLKLMAIMILIDGATVINCDIILATHGSLILTAFEPVIKGTWFSNIRASVMLLGAVSTYFVVKKFNRRWLLLFGYSTSGIIQAWLALCYYVEERNRNQLDYLAFIIAFLLLTYVLVCASTNETTVNILKSEIFPHRMKEFYISLLEITRDALTFVAVKFYLQLSTSLGIHMLLFYYSVFAFLSFILIYTFIPDTKDKTLYEIRQIYRSYNR